MSKYFRTGGLLMLALVASAGAEQHASTEGPITALPKLTSVANLSAVPAVRPFDIRQWETANGIPVMFVRSDDLPMLDVRLIFDAGSARDGEIPGLASTVASMLDEGTATRSGEELAQGFERLGAEFRSSSARDMAVMELRVLTDAALMNPALELFADVLANPVFPEKNYQRVHSQSQVGQQQKQQSPAALASIAFYRELYGKHPYATPPTGTLETIKKIKPDDLRTFHRQFYVARNAVLTMVGAISEERAREISEQVSKSLAAGEKAQALPEVAPLRKERRLHTEYGSQQTHILIGQPGVRRGHPDYYALYVGNEILGGGGFTSILTREIREKRGLSYGVSSGFLPMNARGPFTVSMQTRNDQASQAVSVTREVLREFVEKGPTDQQVQEAIENIVGGYPLGLASNYSIIGNLGAMAFYGLPKDYLEKFPERIREVDADKIRKAFRKHINPDRMLIITVGQAGSNEKKP